MLLFVVKDGYVYGAFSISSKRRISFMNELIKAQRKIGYRETTDELKLAGFD